MKYYYYDNQNGTFQGGTAPSNSSPTNKLAYVLESGDNPNLNINFDDIKTGMAPDNFQYDEIGRLIKDKSGEIELIVWNGSVALIPQNLKIILLGLKLTDHVQAPSLSKSNHLTSRLFEITV
jgi:hypothetical protein